MKQDKNVIFFFIGTEAELIKIFPIILEAKQRNLNFKIIASGQNDISKSRILEIVNDGKVDILLSDPLSIQKSTLGLLTWFITTRINAVSQLEKYFCAKSSKSIMVVHGDTISTVLGAQLGKKFGMKIAHIEAGYRSHNYFSPFPEEIDRVLTSKYAQIHFAPGKDALDNLVSIKGKKINTHFNTILDSLNFSKKYPALNPLIDKLKETKYFVLVLHRQENLMDKKFVKMVMKEVISASKNTKAVIILHEPTQLTLEKIGLVEQLKNEENIIMTQRLDYIDFMNLIDNASFVLTDGGSNQQELFYMGKPCLLLRERTEGSEGLGRNVLLSKKKLKTIQNFIDEFEKYKYSSISTDISPTQIIIKELEEFQNNG